MYRAIGETHHTNQATSRKNATVSGRTRQQVNKRLGSSFHICQSFSTIGTTSSIYQQVDRMRSCATICCIMTVLSTQNTAIAWIFTSASTDPSKESIVFSGITLLVISISQDIIRTVGIYDTIATSHHLTGTATVITIVRIAIIALFVIRGTQDVVFSIRVLYPISTTCESTRRTTSIQQARLAFSRS